MPTTRLRETRTTEPAKEAVDLQQVKSWLRVADSDVADDPIIMGLIRVATEQCERYTGRSLITQTWTAFIDGWPRIPSSDNYWEGYRQGPETLILNPAPGLDLNHAPLQSITSVSTFNDSDTETTYDSSNYFVDTSTEPGRIVLRTGASVPAPTRVANGIKIVYVAGYGDDPDDVPEGVRHGISALVADLYEHRGDAEPEDQLPDVARISWEPYRLATLW